MVSGIPIAVVVASVAVILLLVFLIIKRCRRRKSQNPSLIVPNRGRAENLETGVARLHHLDRESTKRKTNYYVFRRGVSSKPLFSWADNPSLITDAVENGWSRFAFTNYASYTASSSVRSARTLLGVCAAGDEVNENGVEIDWEVCQGSADFMQKIRLNSGLKKINTSNFSANSVIKTALPFPGPPLGNSAFPQEAYFEITIMSNGEESDGSLKFEGEKAKLIKDNSESAGLVDVKVDEMKLNDKEGNGEAVVLSVGLSGGGSLPLKLPGSYSGSIGFNSNGSAYLDGTKLVSESEKHEWGRIDKVIGCGYNPSQKRVFLTLDSELVQEVHCKSEEYGTPLYPTLATNSDVTVLVNFGQSAFKYAPANLHRTPNPCFIGPLANSPSLGYEDSKELFSMGRIDSQWMNRSTTRGRYMYGSSTNRGPEFDEISEGDLFEIALDSSSIGRSPHTPM